eukprot:595124-Pelagomonas_calceolata.AAC.5
MGYGHVEFCVVPDVQLSVWRLFKCDLPTTSSMRGLGKYTPGKCDSRGLSTKMFLPKQGLDLGKKDAEFKLWQLTAKASPLWSVTR